MRQKWRIANYTNFCHAEHSHDLTNKVVGGYLCGFFCCFGRLLDRVERKAILDILGQNEGLTLTQISNQLHRTPGSTKDYLSWLEDVDLITSHQKRYSFADPLLRVWVRLHCHTMPPEPDEVVREVQQYATERIPKEEPSQAPAYSDTTREDQVVPKGNKQWDIIEID